MLSKTKYALLCVLGMEIFYVLCIIYGVLLSGKAKELHHGFFETNPWFRLGKSREYGVGCRVHGSAGMDRGLVHRMDAQREHNYGSEVSYLEQQTLKTQWRLS
jgi:hypothetical protein